MDVVDLPLERLIPYARNPRKNDTAISTVAASLKEFGWRQPIVVDEEMVILAGHTRLEAARQLGFASAPVHIARGLTPAQARAYRLMDNRASENAEWDEALLGLELGDLQGDGFDLALTGFDDAELNRLLAGLGEDGDAREGEDDVPETPTDPVSRPGDLWLLGPHRLLCGDSTVATDVERVLNGVTPLLMVSDPPYGVEYDPGWRNQAGAARTRRTGKVLNDDRADWREAWALFPGDVAYVWHGALHATTVAESLEVAGFAIRSQIIWAKERLVLGRGDYHWQHEPIAGMRSGRAARATGRATASRPTLWQISSRDQDAETVHGTQKPVECMRRPILNNSSPGEAVYEPFMGSGTTLIAAETTGRVCLGIELNPAYVDVAVERWQRFTGQVGGARRRRATGFDALKDERSLPAHPRPLPSEDLACACLSPASSRAWSGTPSARAAMTRCPAICCRASGRGRTSSATSATTCRRLGPADRASAVHLPRQQRGEASLPRLPPGERRRRRPLGEPRARRGFFLDMLRAPPAIAVENPIMLGHVRRLFDIPRRRRRYSPGSSVIPRPRRPACG